MKNYYKTFDDYVKDYPGGELWRGAYVGRRRKDQVFMVRGNCEHGGLPGGFFFMISSDTNGDGPCILAEDNDDGIRIRVFKNTWDRDAVFQELRNAAPFSFSNLVMDWEFTAW